MVGLSILLEGQKNSDKGPVINKVIVVKTSPPLTNSSSAESMPSSLYSPSPLPAISFLDSCFLCKQRLLPGQDIFMYKGDRAFCSEECRYKQIFIDETESNRRNYCYLSDMNVQVKPSSSSSSSSASSRHSHRRETRNRAGRFAW